MSDGHDSPQDRSGHLLGKSVNPKDSGSASSIPDGQPSSGYRDGHGAVNASRATGGTVVEGQYERGYKGATTGSAPTRRAKDGVDKELPRI